MKEMKEPRGKKLKKICEKADDLIILIIFVVPTMNGKRAIGYKRTGPLAAREKCAYIFIVK